MDDIILNDDGSDLFKGTPDQVKQYLRDNPVKDQHITRVFCGRVSEIVNVWEYLFMYN